MDKVRQALDRAREERRLEAGDTTGAQHAALPRVFVGEQGRATVAIAAPQAALAPVDVLESEVGRATVATAALQTNPPPVLDREVGPPTVATEALARPFDTGPEWLEKHRVLQAEDRSDAGQAFRMLRTQVLQRMQENGWQTLGIVSARSLDGKTTVAANLAIAIASDPRYTAVLVDLDLQRPAVGTVFGASAEGGVDDVLRERATVDAVLLRPHGIDGLRLLPVLQPSSTRTSALVARPACAALIAELKSRYANRIIVIDMPPVLDNDDALTLAPLCDCLLFVVSEGRTARTDVTRALGLLRARPILGTVLNNSSATQPTPAGRMA